MGKLKNGILGGFSGKVGPVTGSSYKDLDLVKSNQRIYKDPKTPLQVNQRQKFAFVSLFLKPIKILTDNWSGQDPEKVKRNPALSYHIKNAVNGNYPNFELDCKRVIITRGELPGVINATVELTIDNKLSFRWLDNTGHGIAAADDRFIVVLYDATQHQSIYYRKTKRETGYCLIPLKQSLIGQPLGCWISFVSANGKVQANSQYLSLI